MWCFLQIGWYICWPRAGDWPWFFVLVLVVKPVNFPKFRPIASGLCFFAWKSFWLVNMVIYHPKANFRAPTSMISQNNAIFAGVLGAGSRFYFVEFGRFVWIRPKISWVVAFRDGGGLDSHTYILCFHGGGVLPDPLPKMYLSLLVAGSSGFDLWEDLHTSCVSPHGLCM